MDEPKRGRGRPKVRQQYQDGQLGRVAERIGGLLPGESVTRIALHLDAETLALLKSSVALVAQHERRTLNYSRIVRYGIKLAAHEIAQQYAEPQADPQE
jgi:hypothetical protein